MNKLKEMNGKYYQECSVVMLATDKKGFTLNINSQGVLHIPFDPNTPQDYIKLKNKPQHLYFLSNEEIKEGDGYLNIVSNEIVNVDFNIDYEQNHCKKIIATTDTSLELPQPSKSFIQAFIAAYNEGKPITKVLVEYWAHTEEDLQLKVNSSNKITIKKVKDSYTREEVIQILVDYSNNLLNQKYRGNTAEVINQFVEENL